MQSNALAVLRALAVASAAALILSATAAGAATAGNGGGQAGATGGQTGGQTSAGPAGGQTNGTGGTGGQTASVGQTAPAAAPAASESGGVVRREEPVPAHCGLGIDLPSPQAFADPGDGTVALSHATKFFVRDCRCDTQVCIADALDAYAKALAVVAPRMRPELRDLPAVVARAAARVRIAPSKTAAVAILRETAATVHKAIALIRAPDPDTLKLGTRSGDVVSDALNVAALSLERSKGI